MLNTSPSVWFEVAHQIQRSEKLNFLTIVFELDSTSTASTTRKHVSANWTKHIALSYHHIHKPIRSTIVQLIMDPASKQNFVGLKKSPFIKEKSFYGTNIDAQLSIKKPSLKLIFVLLWLLKFYKQINVIVEALCFVIAKGETNVPHHTDATTYVFHFPKMFCFFHLRSFLTLFRAIGDLTRLILFLRG